MSLVRKMPHTAQQMGMCVSAQHSAALCAVEGSCAKSNYQNSSC